MAISESQLQQIICAYVRTVHPDLLMWSSLNGINLSGKSGKYGEIVKLKRECMEVGVPDLYIALPNGKSLHCELKTEAKDSKQSPDQIALQLKLESLGHTYVVCRNFQEFKKILNKHIKEA